MGECKRLCKNMKEDRCEREARCIWNQQKQTCRYKKDDRLLGGNQKCKDLDEDSCGQEDKCRWNEGDGECKRLCKDMKEDRCQTEARCIWNQQKQTCRYKKDDRLLGGNQK